MVALWSVLALLGLLVLIALLPVEIWVRHHQENERGRLQYRIKVGWVTVAGGTSPTDEAAAEAPRHKEQALRKLPDFLPKSSGELLDWLRPAFQYFRRKLRFRRLNLFIVVGGLDAFESAMLAGVAWTLAGLVGSVISHLFWLPQGLYRVTVQPNWQEPAFGLNLDCMLTFRVGHAIWAGALLVPRLWQSWRAAARRRRRLSEGERAHG